MHERFWGQGDAAEAATRLVRYGFECFKPSCISARHLDAVCTLREVPSSGPNTPKSNGPRHALIFSIRQRSSRNGNIVRINYAYRVVYVRFAGTHSEYDQIDAEQM